MTIGEVAFTIQWPKNILETIIVLWHSSRLSFNEMIEKKQHIIIFKKTTRKPSSLSDKCERIRIYRQINWSIEVVTIIDVPFFLIIIIFHKQFIEISYYGLHSMERMINIKDEVFFMSILEVLKINETIVSRTSNRSLLYRV